MFLYLDDFIMQWFFHFTTGEQVLDDFHDRFIVEMDTMSVVYSLHYEGIISNGVLQQIKTANDLKNENLILFTHLKRTCTKDSLMTTCHKIIEVTGNPRMKALGKNMLSKLEGESDTHASLNRCLHDHASVCLHVSKLSTRYFVIRLDRLGRDFMKINVNAYSLFPSPFTVAILKWPEYSLGTSCCFFIVV